MDKNEYQFKDIRAYRVGALLTVCLPSSDHVEEKDDRRHSVGLLR